jgi:hypothetical protein
MTKRRLIMAANPSVAILNQIPEKEQAVSNDEKLMSLLKRIEAALCKYFGEDEETILNSLRGL